MFNSSVPTNQQPNKQQPTFGKQMGKGSPNANIDRKGTFKGASKKVQHSVTKKKTSAIAPSGKFGQARDIGGGKHNFSRGAPGHQTGGK